MISHFLLISYKCNIFPGGYSGFQVTGMIEWGQKLKPKKIPGATNKTQKNPWSEN